ncbi:hypothetical protein MAAFP003_147 [Mycobacterium ahvazicum]|uniref:Uncharacterized protein n=1 Tax=Mycobacterium ahvazicum TaxID=1964395 RepID=A0A2K4Y3Y3_9MYCO|nr:hypothetical protein [Mycobacterium ahvazicum]SOX51486.1 hypothetical protein MAAFP003_147 [Mycobacterium ahvazicum]
MAPQPTDRDGAPTAGPRRLGSETSRASTLQSALGIVDRDGIDSPDMPSYEKLHGRR